MRHTQKCLTVRAAWGATSMSTSIVGIGGGIDWQVGAKICINTCLLLVAD